MFFSIISYVVQLDVSGSDDHTQKNTRYSLPFHSTGTGPHKRSGRDGKNERDVVKWKKWKGWNGRDSVNGAELRSGRSERSGRGDNLGMNGR
jgi:hypothetical protein